jgi:hydroxyacylglutathione hydrolase
MIHEVLQVGPLRCNCSILGDEQTKQGIVVDPGDDISEIIAILSQHALKVIAIVITHAHIDHIGGAEKLKTATGAPVYMNENDQDLYNHLDVQARWLGIPAPKQTEIDITVRDGDTLKLAGRDLHVLYTPGHTQGSICLWIPSENKLLSGDTLFRETIGRTDLPGGDGRKILLSIRDKLLKLPDDTDVLPGHGGPTTIGHERIWNPFLRN